MLSLFYKPGIIHGEHSVSFLDLAGQLFLVNIKERLFLKRRTGKELLEGPDILLPGKMEGDRFYGFTLQRT